MAPKTHYFPGVTTVLALLIIAWQYTVFAEDHRNLLLQVKVLEQAYTSIQDANLLPQKKADVKFFVDKIHEKIPSGDSQDAHFLKTIHTTSLLNNCSYHLWEKKHLPQPFYNQKQIKFKIGGKREDVATVLNRIEKMDRLVNWTTACSFKESESSDWIEAHVSLIIYHFQHLKFHGKSHIKPPELETRAWLPPFTFHLQKTKEKAETIYYLLMATPNSEEQLQQYEEYTWSQDRLLQMESILENLEKERLPLKIRFTGLSTCLST